MVMSLEDLPTLVKQKYDAAKAAQSLIFSSTDLALVRVAGLPFQLRYCPALSQKPVQNDHSSERSPLSEKPDPFAEPSSDLLITQIPKEESSHILVLNKYPVISQHFILATKAFKEQTDLLEECDLTTAFNCLKAWASCPNQSSVPKKLFAFFNSGLHSGASQPHRHIQFLPVEKMEDAQAAAGWSLLSDHLLEGAPLPNVEKCLHNLDTLEPFRPHSLAQLPFVHFAVALPSDSSPNDLYQRYRYLYKRAVGAYQVYAEGHPDEDLILGSADDHSAVISYNLALTTTSMVICPRRSEGAILRAGKHNRGKSLGPIAMNATILAGTLMVKTEEEWLELRRDESKLYNLLRVHSSHTSLMVGPRSNTWQNDILYSYLGSFIINAKRHAIIPLSRALEVAFVMSPVSLPAIVTPALLSSIRGHPQLPLHSWYFIAGVTLSVLNRPDEIPKVFQYAVERGMGNTDTKPQHEEQLEIARKMREALVKAAPIGGLPKAINALFALKAVTPPSLLDEPLGYSPTARPVEVYDIPSSQILHRGQTFFDRIYSKVSKRVMGQMDRSGTEDLGITARLMYGYILSNTSVLTAAETSFVLLAGLIPQD
ncbi:MAG: bifunctional AP-4-A phosphorylase/ADP sulfurylase, partial [Pleopsidium flavum]